MKIFLSWSGQLSQSVAEILKDWLPCVLQFAEPYFSSKDIDKGTRWSVDISQELEASTFGVIIVTTENISQPWINFEAGALSKSLQKSQVSPLLVDIERKEVVGPLLQFQSTVLEKKDVYALIESINKCAGDQGINDSGRLQNVFEKWWPDLEEKIGTVRREAAAQPSASIVATRSREDILDEVLELSRSNQKLLTTPINLLPPDYFLWILTRYQPHQVTRLPEVRRAYRRFHHVLLEAILRAPGDKNLDELRIFGRELILVLEDAGLESYQADKTVRLMAEAPSSDLDREPPRE
ncbi:hypothetical protein [Nonomuraea sp. NPDC049141]|uniref:hypothetical protein n=1 Tax=unclassified Nonomuraea TaxID=2593643 RepID=UPI00340EC555